MNLDEAHGVNALHLKQVWGLLGIGDGGVRRVVVYVPMSDPGDYQVRRTSPPVSAPTRRTTATGTR